jgi:hypothetical protein
MLGDCVAIKGESRKSFLQLLQFHIDPFQPADGVEFGTMEEMAACKWRLHRAWYLEKGLFEKQLGLESAGDMSPRMPALSSICRRASPRLGASL